VVDGGLTIPAARTTAAQVGVELFQHLCSDLREGHVAERRLDRAPDVAAVTVERRRLRLVRP
jgi:hypothetical protein